MTLVCVCARRTSLRIATQNSLARKSQACAPRAAIGCHSPACVSPRRTRGRPGPRCCQRRGSAGAANGVVTMKKVDFSCGEQRWFYKVVNQQCMPLEIFVGHGQGILCQQRYIRNKKKRIYSAFAIIQRGKRLKSALSDGDKKAMSIREQKAVGTALSNRLHD